MRKRKLSAHMDGPEPSLGEHRRHVSTEQLIAKFKSMCHSQPETTSGYLVASITNVLSEFSLPEVPEEEIYDVLGDVLSACKSPQHSSVEVTVNEGTATPATANTSIRSRSKKGSPPLAKKLQPRSTTTKQRYSLKIDSKHPDNKNTVSVAKLEDPSLNHKVGSKTEDSNKEEALPASPFPPSRVPFVELERLTREEIASLCRRRPSPQSPASKVSQQSGGGSVGLSPAGKKIRSQTSHGDTSNCVQEEEFQDSDETYFDDSGLASKAVQHSGRASPSRVSKATCNQSPRAANKERAAGCPNSNEVQGEKSALGNQPRKEVIQEPNISPLSSLLAPSTLLDTPARSERRTREDTVAHCPKRRHSQSSPVSRASQQTRDNASKSPVNKEAYQRTPEKLSGDANRVGEGGYARVLERDRNRKKGVRDLFEDGIMKSPSLLMSPPPNPSQRPNSVSNKAHPPRKQRTLLASDKFVDLPATSSQPEPELEELTQTPASGQDGVRWRSARVPQDLEPKPTTSQSSARGSAVTTRTYVSPTRTRPAPVKKSRVRFTTLQEEALVYGVMKYGHGSWKFISDEGWFDGRRTTELSDKYRNLEKYGHLPEVRKRVKSMLAAGVNPLKKLRAWNLSRDNPRRVCDHSEQPSVKPQQRLQGLPANTSEGQKDSANELGTFIDSEEEHEADSEVASSLDDCAVPKKAGSRQAKPTQEAAAPSEATDSSTAAPSTSSGTSAHVVHNSDSDDSSSEEHAMKTKVKRKRVPFTLLEEEALVSGYLKYGRGNWARILREGGFNRTSIQLSDKFRNLVQYRRLSAITNIVNAKIDRGEDPLLELRKHLAKHWER